MYALPRADSQHPGGLFGSVPQYTQPNSQGLTEITMSIAAEGVKPFALQYADNVELLEPQWLRENQRYLDPECSKICWLIKFKPCEVLPWPITIEGGIGHENQESQSQSSLDNLFETLFNPTLYTLEEMPDCPRTYNRRTPVPCLAAPLSFIGSAPNKPNDPCYNMQQHHIHSKSQKAWLCL